MNTKFLLKKYGECADIAKSVIALKPSNASFVSHLYTILFFCSLEQNFPEEECMKHWNEANRLVKGYNPEMWFHASLYYYKLENWDQALYHILRCCSLPEEFLVEMNMGYNYDMIFNQRWEFLEKIVNEHFPDKNIDDLLKNLDI